MFDLFVEMIQLCWQNYYDNQVESPKDKTFEHTIMLWVASFVFGCVVGLLYCEHFAVLPTGVDPPISEIYAIIIEDLFMRDKNVCDWTR